MNGLRTSRHARVFAYFVGAIFLVALAALTLWPIAGSFVPPPRLNAADEVHLDRLLYAIDTADAASVQSLLSDRRIDVNGTDRQGDTPLIRAARSGWASGCQLLLEHRADVDAANAAGETALSCAVRAPRDADRVVELLLEHGAKVNGRDRRKVPIVQAAFARRGEIVELLMKGGADLNAAETNGWTALHWAVVAPDTELLRLMIAHHANVRATDDQGETPLDIAHAYENAEAEKLLRSAEDGR